MPHLNCQITGSSPKKTPQSTPAKVVPMPGLPEVNKIDEPDTPKKSALIPERKLAKVSLKQKFGCLRLNRMSCLLLSTHC